MQINKNIQNVVVMPHIYIYIFFKCKKNVKLIYIYIFLKCKKNMKLLQMVVKVNHSNKQLLIMMK